MSTDPRLPSAGAVGSPVILVVEDEPLIRLTISEYLRDRGFEVIEAASGDEAQFLFIHDTRIDIVFTDVQMPGVLDGLALARWLGEVHPTVMILVASGIADLRALACQVCERASVFEKPYDHQAIVDRIRVLAD